MDMDGGVVVTPTYPFPPELEPYYVSWRWVPHRGWCGVQRLLFHYTMHYGITPVSWEGRYCFERLEDALWSMSEWSGAGDPPGRWHKHPDSGRRRDPDTGETWDEEEYRP